jgi:spermidine/putrescine-binding protein
MTHPKDRSGLTRRQLLGGAAGAALSVGAVGGLAACQNTTTPIGVCEDGSASPLVEAKPTGPLGLPLPRIDNSVTWAITDDNPPIPDGKKLEGGTLTVFNYPDYIYPGLLKKFQQETGSRSRSPRTTRRTRRSRSLLPGRSAST